MIEKQTIGGKDIWMKVDAYHMERSNPNIIPTEYFTVSYYKEEPGEGSANGQLITDEEGQPKLFESPVAALAHARKKLETSGSL